MFGHFTIDYHSQLSLRKPPENPYREYLRELTEDSKPSQGFPEDLQGTVQRLRENFLETFQKLDKYYQGLFRNSHHSNPLKTSNL